LTRWLWLAVLCVAACPASAFDSQGHRGARGLAPENTMAAFRAGLAQGVTTLETDLAVTRDGVVVISHNPRLNPDLTRDAEGRFLPTEGPRIRDLTLAELGRYDIGRIDPQSKYARQFPQQKPSDGERFPTLAALLELVRPTNVRLNVETKLAPDHPDDAPPPEEFARRVVETIEASGLASRVTIQSFDWRTLVAVKRLQPALRTSCVTMQTANNDNVASRDGKPSPWTAGLDLREVDGSVPRLVQRAGCDIWSPFYRNVTPALVSEAHALHLEVLPWTVNDPG
jgi:glycerophosphoryl diester phosphodiesterase